jgi:sulfur carrier protein
MITVNGTPLEHTPGMTVADVLKARNYIFRMLAVSVNGQLVPRKAYATTTVPDGADVQVIHMISGGGRRLSRPASSCPTAFRGPAPDRDSTRNRQSGAGGGDFT